MHNWNDIEYRKSRADWLKNNHTKTHLSHQAINEAFQIKAFEIGEKDIEYCSECHQKLRSIEEPKALWEGTYFTLFDDETIGCSDGVGYVGGLDKEEVRSLYEALKSYYQVKEVSNGK